MKNQRTFLQHDRYWYEHRVGYLLCLVAEDDIRIRKNFGSRLDDTG